MEASRARELCRGPAAPFLMMMTVGKLCPWASSARGEASRSLGEALTVGQLCQQEPGAARRSNSGPRRRIRQAWRRRGGGTEHTTKWSRDALVHLESEIWAARGAAGRTRRRRL